MINRLGINPHSMIYRLSLYFALMSLLLAAVMGGYLCASLDHRLEEEHTGFLASDIDTIRSTLTKEVGDVPVEKNPRWHNINPVGSRLHITIFSDQKALLVAAPNLMLPQNALPMPVDLQQRVEQSLLWKSPSGKYYRLVAAWAALGPQQSQKVLVALALDISIEHRLLMHYYRAVLVAILAVALCAALTGYWVARRGLMPIKRITTAVNDITSSQLDKRLELADAPAELRDLATAFNSMLDRLGESFSRLTQFSSDLSHELRTPINNLMGEAQVALSRARTATEYREVLESSLEELDRLSRMTENMLFLARTDQPEAGITPVWIDARGEIEKLAEFYQIAADESAVRIQCSGSARVYADLSLLRRAVSNLLSNALHHMPQNSVVDVILSDNPNGSTIAVSNPGPGIPAQHLPRIFDRFYQVDSSRERSRDGVGLGLAIVHSIMRLHRGCVYVTSDATSSTVFSLHFPDPNQSG